MNITNIIERLKLNNHRFFVYNLINIILKEFIAAGCVELNQTGLTEQREGTPFVEPDVTPAECMISKERNWTGMQKLRF